MKKIQKFTNMARTDRHSYASMCNLKPLLHLHLGFMCVQGIKTLYTCILQVDKYDKRNTRHTCCLNSSQKGRKMKKIHMYM